MTSKLIVTRGLPASGKTTWALSQAGCWHFSRDLLRAAYVGTWDYGSEELETPLTAIQYACVGITLEQGFDVIVDDCNLHPAYAEGLATVAAMAGADFEVKDFTDVPLEVCLERDAARVRPVGRDVIMAMHAKYLAD